MTTRKVARSASSLDKRCAGDFANRQLHHAAGHDPQDIEQRRRGWQRFSIPEQVHDIVEVAGTCAFGECPHLFSEQLFIGVGKHIDPFFGRVRVRMKNTHALWRKDNALVRCEVELDSWEVTRRYRAAIADPALAGG